MADVRSSRRQCDHVSYGAFLEQVYRASNVLIELGVWPSDRILLHLANSPEFLLLWFAAATMGATIVPTNPLSADAELAYLCGHAEATLIVVAPDAIEWAERLRSACPTVRHVLVCGPAPAGMVSLPESLSGVSTRPPNYKPRHEDVVAVLYTSGTTSRPKGCLITNANYVFAGEAVGQHIGITPTDRLLVVLPYFHANAQYYSTMPALLAGGSLIVAERFSASRYFSTAARHGATLGSLFAAPMRMLLAQPEAAVPPVHQLRLVMFAQNVTAAQLGEWERRFRAPLMQIYGMTEQLGQPLANPLHGHRDNMTVGRPTLGFRCRVIDDAGDNVGDGIAVRFGTVMRTGAFSGGAICGQLDHAAARVSPCQASTRLRPVLLARYRALSAPTRRSLRGARALLAVPTLMVHAT